MKVTEDSFANLVLELIDENPFAVRSLFRILRIVYTGTVPTLAVTCRAEPELLVNLEFVEKHCKTESHIKALLCHEFLHVLLRHTEEQGPYSLARHLAFDAVINAIIHRQLGPNFSSLMATYYADQQWPRQLLRPPREGELRDRALTGRVTIWRALYEGQLIADDVAAIASGLAAVSLSAEMLKQLLGNHDELGQSLSAEVKGALDQALKEMNGSGVWRAPRSRGVGADAYETLRAVEPPSRRDWQRTVAKLLRRHLSPDRQSRQRETTSRPFLLPVLSTSDRRAFLRSTWSHFLPDARWEGTGSVPVGTAQLYFDVSGSMNHELAALSGLLGSLSRWIRRPFWAFSDKVAPAVIRNGFLRTSTSGGTSLACVLEHVARTKPSAAVIVTDGIVGNVDREMLGRCRATRLHVLISADGSPAAIAKASLPWTKLSEVPR